MRLTRPNAFPLKPARVHEVEGAGATAFAAIVAAGTQGAVLWVAEAWRRDLLAPIGLARFADPSRFLLARATGADDILAVMEEGLRSGAVALAVAEVARPIGLTPGRRLQLAAEAGRATGLCLLGEGMGSNAAETRWRAEPLFDAAPERDSTLFRWTLKKNKSGTCGVWNVRWNATAHRLDVVSAAADGSGGAGASDDGAFRDRMDAGERRADL